MSKTIAVQCGHGVSLDGSWDPGCVYKSGRKQYTEAALMLKITKAAVKYLRKSGVTVISDSDHGNNKNMIEDVRWANNVGCKLYVSIHCDYSGAPKGVMPLYVSASGKKIGKCLKKHIKKDLKMKSRGVQKRTNLWELNGTDMPACILETGSIKADLATLKGKGWTIWKDSKGHKYVRLVSVPKSTKADKLLAALKTNAAKMIKAHVRYSANHACKSLASALKNKRTNCATFVSFGLQSIGVLPKGKYIWLDKKIHGSGSSRIRKKAKIAYPRKSWKYAKLKKGDICGFANKPHTMVYAGKSKHGYPLWYSAGGSDVKAKNYGPKRKKSYEKRKIYVRIRLK